MGSCLHNSWAHQREKTSGKRPHSKFALTSLGYLIDPFGWRKIVVSLSSLKTSLKKASKPQCCWQNWGWMLCSHLGELLSLCKQECGIKMCGKRVNGKLCVCVSFVRAFSSINVSCGCIHCSFNAKFVFAIVWIHIFLFFWCQNIFENVVCCFFTMIKN